MIDHRIYRMIEEENELTIERQKSGDDEMNEILCLTHEILQLSNASRLRNWQLEIQKRDQNFRSNSPAITISRNRYGQHQDIGRWEENSDSDSRSIRDRLRGEYQAFLTGCDSNSNSSSKALYKHTGLGAKDKSLQALRLLCVDALNVATSSPNSKLESSYRSGGPTPLPLPLRRSSASINTRGPPSVSSSGRGEGGGVVGGMKSVDQQEGAIRRTGRVSEGDDCRAVDLLHNLQLDRAMLTKLGLHEKASSLDVKITALRSEVQKEKENAEKELLLVRISLLKVTQRAKMEELEKTLKEELALFEASCTKEEMLLAKRQEREFILLLDNTARKASSGVGRSVCSCTSRYLCRHNRSAASSSSSSSSVRAVPREVRLLQRNAELLRRANRLEDAALCEAKAAELEDSHLQQLRDSVCALDSLTPTHITSITLYYSTRNGGLTE